MKLIPRSQSETAYVSYNLSAYDQDITSGTEPELVASLTYNSSVRHSSFSGVNIQQFHKLRREGILLPHTSFTKHLVVGSATGTWDYYYKDRNNHLHHNWFDPCWGTVPDAVSLIVDAEAFVPAMDNRWAQEAANKIYGNSYDVLTSILELKDTISMFRTVGKKLANLKLPKNWRSIPNTWMEWRYGWRTLIFDLMALNECIQSWDEKRKRFSERAGTHWSSSTANSRNIEQSYFILTEVINEEARVSLRGNVTADIDLPRLMVNPVATAWELIPLSFVVDWFLSVGKAISALSLISMGMDYRASTGYKIEYLRNYKRSISSTKSGFVSGTVGYTYSTKVTIEHRSPCTIPLTPHLTFNMNTSKVFDLACIVLQRLK